MPSGTLQSAPAAASLLNQFQETFCSPQSFNLTCTELPGKGFLVVGRRHAQEFFLRQPLLLQGAPEAAGCVLSAGVPGDSLSSLSSAESPRSVPDGRRVAAYLADTTVLVCKIRPTA